MKIFLISLLLLIYAGTAAGQIDTERIPPALDNGDLYSRAAASRFVVVGTIVKAEGVSKRLTPTLLEAMKRDANLGTGGSLFTIQSEETVCRRSDFDVSAIDANEPVVADNPQTIHIFIPFDEPAASPGRFQEILIPGRRYLLFLTEADSQQRRAWIDAYQLDRSLVYYRGVEQNRGVIPLVQATPTDSVPKQPDIAYRIRRLCEAMYPEKPEQKLAALKALAESRDPILGNESQVAMEDIMRKMPHEERQKLPK